MLRTLFVLLASGCTLNVASVSGDVRVDGTPAYDTLSIDVTGAPALEGAGVVVTGGEDDSTAASAHVVGLRTLDQDPDALLAAWRLALGDGDPLPLRITAPDDDATLLERLDVVMPAARDVELVLGSSSASLSNLRGRVTAEASSGSIDCTTRGVVELRATSGSIDAGGAAGTLSATSGSIHLVLGGWVNASAESGSIDGTIGDGGSVTTTSGSIALTLTAPLTRDLVLSADSGSVSLHLPPGIGVELDLGTGSGTAHVELSSFEASGHEVTQTILGGGPRIHVRTGSGSIHIDDRTE